jgi:hypothetical protein
MFKRENPLVVTSEPRPEWRMEACTRAGLSWVLISQRMGVSILRIPPRQVTILLSPLKKKRLIIHQDII